MTTKIDNAQEEAQAQLESIKEMVENLRAADDQVRDGGDDLTREKAELAITESPLEVAVRSDWHEPGISAKEALAAEYKILLCAGGPAVRIIGTLGKYEPDSARIEYQDWGTPWTEYRMSHDDEQIVLEYARCFYFGE